MTIQEIEEACKNGGPIVPVNTAYSRMEYPLTRMFYPFGFPVEISTNSEAVLEVAAESWGEFTEHFKTPPIRIQAGVFQGRSDECPPAPSPRVQQHLFQFIADDENFGVIDMATGYCGMWLTHAAVANRSYLRHFFVQCAVVCPIATRFATGVHAGCVSRNGVGVLLCGDSGAGKSTLSYACAKAGWTYTTDDSSFMVNDSEEMLVVGNCYQVRFRPASSVFFPEIEGREITKRAEAGKPSIEVDPATLPGIRVSQTARAKHLVVLNRRDGINAPLRPYSKEVMRIFLRQGRFTPPDMLPQQYATMDRLLQVEVHELRYTDLDWAIAQLEALVETGHR